MTHDMHWLDSCLRLWLSILFGTEGMPPQQASANASSQQGTISPEVADKQKKHSARELQAAKEAEREEQR